MVKLDTSDFEAGEYSTLPLNFYGLWGLELYINEPVHEISNNVAF